MTGAAAAPGRAGVWPAFWRAGLRLSAVFAVGFYGADAITSMHGFRLPLHMDWERHIPWWPPAYLAYFSVLLVPMLVLAFAPDASAVRHWERRMLRALLIALPLFVLLPSEPAYPPPDAALAARWSAWQGLAQQVAGQHNLMPSLHVALSAITLQSVAVRAGTVGRVVLMLVFALLLASVLLTHQHHVVDALAGGLLGWFVCRQRLPGAGDTAAEAGPCVARDSHHPPP